MGDDKPPTSLKELDARLKAARARGNPPHKGKGGGEGVGGGLGLALRMATELVAGLAVGVVIGLGLDAWLDTKPWFLILFLFLGAAAGMLNMYRTVKGLDQAIGYRRPPGNGQPEREDRAPTEAKGDREDGS